MGKKIKSKATSSCSNKAASCSSKTSASTVAVAKAAAVDKSSSSIMIQKQQFNAKEKKKGFNHCKKGGRSNATRTGGAIIEDKELSSVLFSCGYRIKYMVGDGNCLFRSIADQLRYNKIVVVSMCHVMRYDMM